MRSKLALVLVLLSTLMSMFVCGSTPDYDTCLLLCETSSNYGNCAADCCIKWPVQCEEAAQQ